MNRPSGRTGALRSSESVSELMPQVVGDVSGASISGASPFENETTVDGLSPREPVFGREVLPLSTERS
ncbi:hypothetical protein HPC49_04630 [Pyxidicoccus fallax]|uniref:Uncharacterized protein n=1 Tax=Pyxidicoccus fallax TaxID=394095 RepID=A0A848LJP1_9BACT|nr:hypothetical protein [Pyxidicoccus fallax]NMO17975.1 hypothetical protein [Pyxidicoccus fallax]NPC77536.1 hypothetical protein [Pyxidicoccus fallax]